MEEVVEGEEEEVVVVEGEEKMWRAPTLVSQVKTDFQLLILPAPLTGEAGGEEEEGQREEQLVMKTTTKNCESLWENITFFL